MTKRTAPMDVVDVFPIQDLPVNVIRYYFFPHVSSLDAARLRATCHWFKALVDSVKRFRLHYLRYNHPAEVDFGDLHWWPSAIPQHVADQLWEYGYTGEGQRWAHDTRTDRGLILNDFYGRGFSSDRWIQLVEHLEKDKEFDFRWRFIEFPPLPGVERYPLPGGRETVHRGSCVMISYK